MGKKLLAFGLAGLMFFTGCASKKIIPNKISLNKVVCRLVKPNDSAWNSNYQKVNEKWVREMDTKSVMLPDSLRKFSNYRKDAEWIEIREWDNWPIMNAIFRSVVYKNKTLGDVAEYYRYLSGRKGEGKLNKNPVLYHFDLNKDRIESMLHGWEEWLYDEMEDKLNGNEVHKGAIPMFRSRFLNPKNLPAPERHSQDNLPSTGI